jgi:predicted amidohydrolase
MPRPINVAAIQMDANPAPLDERLERAERLVTDATYRDAQLVVLPELFNTGYTYSSSNFRNAESWDGPTIKWMRDLAAYLNIYLAGTLLLRDCTDVHNSMLLFSPDEQVWRYDKNYPWGWERGYFQPGHGITIADTELGRVGMMVCWDIVHPELWRQYAGKIDLMLISSCPANVGNPTYHFPNGNTVTVDRMGPVMASFKNSGNYVFGEMLNRQTAWLGVPTINSGACGHIETNIPNGFGSLLATLVTAPWLIGYLPQVHRVRLACNFVPSCKIINASGQVLTELNQSQGETFTSAQVMVAHQTPQTQGRQPGTGLSPLLYLSSDTLIPWLSMATYRRGLRETWGEGIAPGTVARRNWLIALCLGMLMIFVIGWLLGKQRR